MSKYKQIVKLTAQGLTPKEIAKKTNAKINYIYFVRNKVKKDGKKKPSKIIEAVKETKAALDALKIDKKPQVTRMSKEDLDFLRTKPKYRFASASIDLVNKPPHYTAGGVDFLDYAEAKGLTENAYLFNVVKYVSRAGKKVDADPVQDLQKAEFYLKREIERRKSA